MGMVDHELVTAIRVQASSDRARHVCVSIDRYTLFTFLFVFAHRPRRLFFRPRADHHQPVIRLDDHVIHES